jgi:hypothetical protein
MLSKCARSATRPSLRLRLARRHACATHAEPAARRGQKNATLGYARSLSRDMSFERAAGCTGLLVYHATVCIASLARGRRRSVIADDSRNN